MPTKPKEISRFIDRYQDMDRDALIALVRREKWFHNMRLQDIDTGSWVYENNLPQNYHLFPTFQYLNELHLSAAVCLDIGTYDGMTAFSLAARGAVRVDATCQHDLDRFRIARALLGYRNIAYFPNTDLDLIHTNFQAGQYDLVVMTAMLHHLLSPLEALLEARRLLKPEGFLLLEAAVREGGKAEVKLNTALDDPVFGSPTIWIPSAEAVKEMLRFAGFNPVSEIHLIGIKPAREPNYDRVTFLAQAVARNQIADRTEKLVEFHTKIETIGGYRFTDFEAPTTARAVIDRTANLHPKRYVNVWSHQPQDPLQPDWKEQSPERATAFKIAENDDFCRLVEHHPDGAFTEEDLRFLPSRYPGQCMPEGMRWGLKQLGNLHVLDYIETWGLKDILEIGPGFNLYFPNHLPDYCNYTGLDDAGFYDQGILRDADEAQSRRRRVTGLLGMGNHGLAPGSFDACISVSVLEHVPDKDTGNLCREMYELLRPGGWAFHSIDLSQESVVGKGRFWLGAIREAGFLVNESSKSLCPDDTSKLFLEPLSIVMSFYGGYRKTIWNGEPTHPRSRVLTILVAARKPYDKFNNNSISKY